MTTSPIKAQLVYTPSMPQCIEMDPLLFTLNRSCTFYLLYCFLRLVNFIFSFLKLFSNLYSWYISCAIMLQLLPFVAVYKCTFESSDLCGFKHGSADDMQWEWHGGDDYVISADHTTQTGEGDHFITFAIQRIVQNSFLIARLNSGLEFI